MSIENLEYILLVILFMLSAFFSGSETAFISANRFRIKKLAEEGCRNAKIADKLLENPQKLITTVLIGNNLVNIAAASIATSLAIKAFGDYGVGIATGVVTILILIFGEVIPKNIAIRNSERFALTAARFIYLCEKIFLPISLILTGITNFMLTRFGIPLRRPLLTEEEIKTIIEYGAKEGVIEKEEKEIIKSVFKFGDTDVKEIMVPRLDIVAIEADKTIKEALDLILRTGHSKIPVYEGNIDNIIGMIYVKDVLNYIKEGKNPKVRDIVRKILFVPESKKLDDLLREMQESKIHMAIVVDEYGGVSGLVTLEDIIEEIVGEIEDEFDREEKKIIKISEDEAVVDARLNISDVEEALGIKLPKGEYDTIAGLILDRLERIPSTGEKVTVDDVELIVEKMVGRRIFKVRIRKIKNKHKSKDKNNKEIKSREIEESIKEEVI